MATTLIIAEKPSVASKVAQAIGGTSAKHMKGEGGVGYFEISNADGTIYVTAAVGHLFTIKQSDSQRGYPVLNVEWAPSHLVGTRSAHTKAYLNTIEKVAHKCDRFINACDFDIEGTVIGTNIIKYVNGGKLGKNAQRMKFSTTTATDLQESFSRLMPLDVSNFYAGEARHMLDWLWGINLSRALTFAVHGQSMREMLSIGRVQGPSLAIIAQREKEIQAFVPKPFWRLSAKAKDVEFESARGDMFDKKAADSAFAHTNEHAKEAMVEDVSAKEQKAPPYPPFDLTSLQLEASRALHMDPSLTLSTAQSLYEQSFISYPRTSSQKLPAVLGLPKIISEIAKNPQYADLAKRLIASKRYSPKEGAKSDEAHPAIYPTGVTPRNLSDTELKLYDMITRRFLSCFAEDATVARTKVTVSAGQERYSASGASITGPGWLSFYTYAKIDEKMLPQFQKGEKVALAGVSLKDMQTQPPKRYTKAGLISELEKRELGTKATRAQIIDTLFRRKYVEGTSLMATKFGMVVYDTLAQNCSMIVDENTTKKLEEDMEKITKGELEEQAVIDEGKKMLLDALAQFDKNSTQIAASLKAALRESSTLGKCPKDGGDLVIRRSRVGKQFVACANYPKCTNTYSLPQNALIVPTGKTCEHCHTPFIRVIRKGRRPFEMDLDPNCVTKKEFNAFPASAIERPSAVAQAAQPSATASAPVSAPIATPKRISKKAASPAKRKAPAAKAPKEKAIRKPRAKKQVGADEKE